jgi:hypothetical protein
MPLNLTEILLLVIVLAGAVYAGYMLGRWSVLREIERGASVTPTVSPLPAPDWGMDPETNRAPPATIEPARRASPPPASAGGDPGSTAAPPHRKSAPPPASAGGPAAGDRPTIEPRRTVAPPPARAGLLDTGATSAGSEAKSESGAGKGPRKRG